MTSPRENLRVDDIYLVNQEPMVFLGNCNDDGVYEFFSLLTNQLRSYDPWIKSPQFPSIEKLPEGYTFTVTHKYVKEPDGLSHKASWTKDNKEIKP